MSDLISRQAAIDALKKISFSHWFECGEYLSEDTREIEIINSNKAFEAIEALPSAQSELEDKIRAIGYTGKEGRIYIGGRLFAVRELPQ